MNLFLSKLYTIVEKGDDFVKIELNPTHAIFSGHFPNNPILPGVCALQIAKELLQKSAIAEVGSIRYFFPIDPNIARCLTYSFAKEKGQISIFDKDHILLIEIKKIIFNI
jgi:3-hydroxyacyl-[acyl-carrier-protein] dehydratase